MSYNQGSGYYTGGWNDIISQDTVDYPQDDIETQTDVGFFEEQFPVSQNGSANYGYNPKKQNSGRWGQGQGQQQTRRNSLGGYSGLYSYQRQNGATNSFGGGYNGNGATNHGFGGNNGNGNGMNGFGGNNGNGNGVNGFGGNNGNGNGMNGFGGNNGNGNGMNGFGGNNGNGNGVNGFGGNNSTNGFGAYNGTNPYAGQYQRQNSANVVTPQNSYASSSRQSSSGAFESPFANTRLDYNQKNNGGLQIPANGQNFGGYSGRNNY
jgi:hypothetical protein